MEVERAYSHQEQADLATREVGQKWGSHGPQALQNSPAEEGSGDKRW